ncbi:MAG: SIMPL domain-containing protein [Rhizobiales bacterium]|nr:SIMPL domain-containing protein [Hyphomicrobiales bacterium]
MTGFGLAVHKMQRTILPAGALVAVTLFVAGVQAQTAAPGSAARARIVVVGEGSVTVAPDYARIRSGVTIDGKTAKQASEANTKLMSAVIEALLNFGIARKDIQTSQFSIEPIYTSQSKLSGSAESKLSGYRVSNQVNVTIHQIAQVGDVLDRLIEAGATDAGNVLFLVSERDKTLDQAREAAMADARHKAELYAHASGLNLGRVVWITESSDFEPILAGAAARPRTATAPPPIESGENTIMARVTVGFDIAQ